MKGRISESSTHWSFSAPAPPTPTTRPCVPRLQPVPIQLSSSYHHGDDVFSPPSTGNVILSRSLTSSTTPTACLNGRTTNTILSMLKQPSPLLGRGEQDFHDDDEDARMDTADIEDDLQFTLTLS
jgi:hypothetical protein